MIDNDMVEIVAGTRFAGTDITIGSALGHITGTVFGMIVRWCAHNKETEKSASYSGINHYKYGSWWMFASAKWFNKYYPGISVSSYKRSIKELEDLGLLWSSQKLNSWGLDRTKWYTPNVHAYVAFVNLWHEYGIPVQSVKDDKEKHDAFIEDWVENYLPEFPNVEDEIAIGSQRANGDENEGENAPLAHGEPTIGSQGANHRLTVSRPITKATTKKQQKNKSHPIGDATNRVGSVLRHRIKGDTKASEIDSEKATQEEENLPRLIKYLNDNFHPVTKPVRTLLETKRMDIDAKGNDFEQPSPVERFESDDDYTKYVINKMEYYIGKAHKDGKSRAKYAPQLANLILITSWKQPTIST